ncbi:MAG: hypothetical protein FJ083_05880 [Cyanobacteria bacterium K_Offshore_surface_m2_239]|nr:hypothetical protein [Cyanobacteria bacterium K_Offshore_surface_m2_239]
MAPPSPQPPSDPPATPWALFWLSAIAAAAWVPLLFADQPPRGSIRASSSGPLLPIPLSYSSPPLLAPVPATALENAHPSPVPLVSRSSDLAEPRAWIAASPDSRPAAPPLDPGSLLPQPIRGALLLGGPLGLESLSEKPMVPAARLEQALRARSANRLEAVPPPWRPAMRALLQGADRVLPAEIVRLPAPHLKTPEEYPLVMKADGIAETTVTPPLRSKETLERWARNATLPPSGSAKPLLLVLEPLPTETPTTDPSPPSPPASPEIDNTSK